MLQDSAALLGTSPIDAGLGQRRGALAGPSVFGLSPLSQLAKLRLESGQQPAQQQLQQQLFAGLEQAPAYQYDTAQHLLQQLQILLQQQQQQQQVQHAASLPQVGHIPVLRWLVLMYCEALSFWHASQFQPASRLLPSRVG